MDGSVLPDVACCRIAELQCHIIAEQCCFEFWAWLVCREATRRASLMTDTTVLDETREPLKLPAFEKAVMFAVTQALERWRDEAMEGAYYLLQSMQ